MRRGATGCDGPCSQRQRPESREGLDRSLKFDTTVGSSTKVGELRRRFSPRREESREYCLSSNSTWTTFADTPQCQRSMRELGDSRRSCTANGIEAHAIIWSNGMTEVRALLSTQKRTLKMRRPRADHHEQGRRKQSASSGHSVEGVGEGGKVSWN